MGATPEVAVIDDLIRQRLDEILPQKLQELEDSKTPSMAIIATKGTLDWPIRPSSLLPPPLRWAGMSPSFFTFYGLQLVKKDVSDLKVSPLGNPGMPMKMPFGPTGSRASTGTSQPHPAASPASRLWRPS